ncbi:MAG: hypothetical protein NXI04_17295 [Planctomycetaceae bacterium]|nr:hypothetical protein [Planctomycetaceae bacterium]
MTESLEARTLLTGGDVTPTVGNNLGFEDPRDPPEQWSHSTDASSGEYDSIPVFEPGPITVNPVQGVRLGRTFVKGSANPPAGNAPNFSRMARSIMLYEGERFEFSWFGFVGNDGQAGAKNSVAAYIRDGVGGAYVATDSPGTGSQMVLLNDPNAVEHEFFLPANGFTGWRTKEFTAPETREYRFGVIARKERHRNSNFRVQIGVDDLKIFDNDTHPPTAVFGVPDQSDGEVNKVSWDIRDDKSGIFSRTMTLQQMVGSVWQDVDRNGDGTPDFQNTTDDAGSFSIDSLPPGVYRLSGSATDNDSARGAADRLSDSFDSRAFTISDDDTLAPMVIVDQPNQNDGQQNRVSWTISDFSGIHSRDVRLQQLVDGVWQEVPGYRDTASDAGAFDLDPVGVGKFRLSIHARDADNDWGTIGGNPTDSLETSVVTDVFCITDDDVAPPEILFDVMDQNDGQANRAGWTISDASGVESRDVRLQQLVDGDWQDVPGYQDTDSDAGEFDLDPPGLGTFRLSAWARDDDSDWGTVDSNPSDHAAGSEVSEEFTISDDDLLPPSVTITEGFALDGQANFFTITATDAERGGSGIEQIQVELYKDNVRVALDSDEWGPGLATGDGEVIRTLDLDPIVATMGLGTYRLRARALDNDDDWSSLPTGGGGLDGGGGPGLDDETADRLWSEWAQEETNIVDDDVAAPTVSLSFSGGTVPATSAFHITVTDQGQGGSGVRRVEARLYKDGELVSADPIVWPEPVAVGDEIATLSLNIDEFVLNHGCGDYRLQVRALDDDGDWETANASDRSWSEWKVLDAFIADPALPQVESLQINDGAAQRSHVSSVTVTFSTEVRYDADAFVVTDADGNVVTSHAQPDQESGRKQVTLTFSGSHVEASNSLRDGWYQLTIVGALVTDTQGTPLDGEQSGCAASDFTEPFYRLFGDAGGPVDGKDPVVDYDDYAVFRASYRTRAGHPRFNFIFDHDGDRDVDAADLFAIRRRFNRPLR